MSEEVRGKSATRSTQPSNRAERRGTKHAASQRVTNTKHPLISATITLVTSSACETESSSLPISRCAGKCDSLESAALAVSCVSGSGSRSILREVVSTLYVTGLLVHEALTPDAGIPSIEPDASTHVTTDAGVPQADAPAAARPQLSCEARDNDGQNPWVLALTQEDGTTRRIKQRT